MIKQVHRLAWTAVVAMLAVACSRETPPSPATSPGAEGIKHFDPASVTRGAALFGAYCAQCHGPQAQGHPDWQTPSDGHFAAAPPLNGTGNDWKRSRSELATIIRDGVRRKTDNVDIMPGWKKRMNERDIEDILNWLQSLWPSDVYERWHRAQLAAVPPQPSKR